MNLNILRRKYIKKSIPITPPCDNSLNFPTLTLSHKSNTNLSDSKYVDSVKFIQHTDLNNTNDGFIKLTKNIQDNKKKYIIPPKLDTFYFNDVFSHRVNYEWEIEEQQRRDYINLNDPDNSPYINLESLIPELEYDYDSSHDYSDLSESSDDDNDSYIDSD